MARKAQETAVVVTSVFDGSQSARDVFIGLIADRLRSAKKQVTLEKQGNMDYTEDGDPDA